MHCIQTPIRNTNTQKYRIGFTACNTTVGRYKCIIDKYLSIYITLQNTLIGILYYFFFVFVVNNIIITERRRCLRRKGSVTSSDVVYTKIRRNTNLKWQF